MTATAAAIERATLAAVPPAAQSEWAGWLLAFDHGTVGRAHSAAPLCHPLPAEDAEFAIAGIEARYAAHGLPAVWRVPDGPAWAGWAAALAAHGYRAARPTCVQLRELDERGPPALPPGCTVHLAPQPDAAWAAAFHAASADAADAASRLATLQRGRGAQFGALLQNGTVLALGAACQAHGLVGIHGMRAVPAARGRGLAGVLAAAFLAAARSAGIGEAFLQVEADNAPAQAAWRRAGFATAWTYRYWSRA